MRLRCNSITTKTTSSGTVTADPKYQAYGIQRDTGPVSAAHTFTGQMQDGSGLTFMNARYYDPQTGLFVSPDTIVPDAGSVFGYNRSMYSYGNPLKFSDPSGHDPCDNGSENCDNTGLKDWIGNERYIYIQGYGMFDMDHVKYSKDDIEWVKFQIQEVLGGKLDYVTQVQGVGVIDKRTIIGHYAVAETVTAEQIEQVALGMVMHFEQIVEANQDFTSVFSVEDLPSDYVGWYIGLNPGTSRLTFLTQLNNGGSGEIVGIAEAQLYKYDMGQNFESSPKYGGENISWPPLLSMESANVNSGLWSELDVTIAD